MTSNRRRGRRGRLPDWWVPKQGREWSVYVRVCVRACTCRGVWWSAPSEYKFVYSGKPSGRRHTKLLSVVSYFCEGMRRGWDKGRNFTFSP